jgi:hypothetical protein
MFRKIDLRERLTPLLRRGFKKGHGFAVTQDRPDEAAKVGVATSPDRRRPGRSPVSSAVVPILRRPAGDGVLPGDTVADESHDHARSISPRDALGTARGIVLGVLLSVLFWAAIGVVAYFALR